MPDFKIEYNNTFLIPFFAHYHLTIICLLYTYIAGLTASIYCCYFPFLPISRIIIVVLIHELSRTFLYLYNNYCYRLQKSACNYNYISAYLA